MGEKPIRVQLRRAKGWRMPPNTVKVDRTSRFGNPYRIGDDLIVFGEDAPVKIIRNADAEQVVKAFRRDAERVVEGIARQLKGKNLACWCRIGAPCHADVLLELANRP